MSTVEKVTIFLAVLQTALLAMYGWETFRLRRDAAEQNKLISQQVDNATHQNKLIGEQLKVMADGLEFQRQTIEQDAEPSLHLTLLRQSVNTCTLYLQNAKENVLFTEFRTNDAGLRYGNYDKNNREFTLSRNPDRHIYLAVVYRTHRGQVKAQVFTYYTGGSANIIKTEPNYDYRLLPIVGQVKKEALS